MALRPFKGPFTVEAYQQLATLGVLREDDRVELIDGQVVEMSPIGPPHAVCVDRLNRRLSELAASRAIVRVQNPIVLGRRDAPQPDLALLRPPIDRYATSHPQAPDILLVIEVADTTLAYDREVKLPLYARAGIPEAWLVDLAGRAIAVHRGPAPDGYREIVTATRGASLRPLLLAEVAIGADEILG